MLGLQNTLLACRPRADLGEAQAYGSNLGVRRLRPNDRAAQKAVHRTPGRCLKGRWGSIDSVEELILGALPYLRELWPMLFQKFYEDNDDEDGSHPPPLAPEPGGDEPEAARGRGRGRGRARGPARRGRGRGGRPAPAPGADEDAEFKARMRTMKRNSVFMVGSREFDMIVNISHISKGPLMHCMHWLEKASKVWNKRVEAAAAEDRTYLGSTPASEFVAHKEAEIRHNISELLSPPKLREKWGAVVHIACTDEERSACLGLIVEAVLLVGASLGFRCTSIGTSLPLTLLLMLEVAAHIKDTRRQTVARLVVETPSCCLTAPMPYLCGGPSDAAAKLKSICLEEFKVVMRTGQAPLNLFYALQVWRSQLRTDSQPAEAMHVLLQGMRKVAPTLGHSLASDRMQIKLGDPITVTECLSLHKASIEKITSAENLARFKPIDSRVPDECTFKYCEHTNPWLLHTSLGYARPVQRLLPIGSAQLFVFDRPLAPGGAVLSAYVASWSFLPEELGDRGCDDRVWSSPV